MLSQEGILFNIHVIYNILNSFGQHNWVDKKDNSLPIRLYKLTYVIFHNIVYLFWIKSLEGQFLALTR